ncbi:unnamed protein product [Amoebophrya sp. A25]|nr:unnamed protein product [Amoebophrya sp. A25]|eukprot:GSA25T00017373001.1
MSLSRAAFPDASVDVAAARPSSCLDVPNSSADVAAARPPSCLDGVQQLLPCCCSAGTAKEASATGAVGGPAAAENKTSSPLPPGKFNVGAVSALYLDRSDKNLPLRASGVVPPQSRPSESGHHGKRCEVADLTTGQATNGTSAAAHADSRRITQQLNNPGHTRSREIVAVDHDESQRARLRNALSSLGPQVLQDLSQAKASDLVLVPATASNLTASGASARRQHQQTFSATATSSGAVGAVKRILKIPTATTTSTNTSSGGSSNKSSTYAYPPTSSSTSSSFSSKVESSIHKILAFRPPPLSLNIGSRASSQGSASSLEQAAMLTARSGTSSRASSRDDHLLPAGVVGGENKNNNLIIEVNDGSSSRRPSGSGALADLMRQLPPLKVLSTQSAKQASPRFHNPTPRLLQLDSSKMQLKTVHSQGHNSQQHQDHLQQNNLQVNTTTISSSTSSTRRTRRATNGRNPKGTPSPKNALPTPRLRWDSPADIWQFDPPVPQDVIDKTLARGRASWLRSKARKIRKKTAAIQGYIADHASLIGKKGSKKSMKAKSKFEKLQEQTRVLDKDASQSQTSSPDAAAIEQAANSIMLEVGGGVRPSPGQHQGSTASSSSTNIAMNKMREERIRSIGAGGGAPESNKARGFGIPLPPHGAGRGEPTSPILQHQNGLRFAAQHASPVYSEGTAGGWASCNDMEDEGGEAESDEEEEETSSEEEEEDGGDEILGYNGFLDLRQEVRELIFRELDDEKIAIIKQLIHDLDSGSIQRINPHMTRDLVISFCQFFGGAESGCMRFLKVTGWNRHKAMDRIARATLWRHFEMPKLDARARNVLDEFNADPKDGCFPCAGSYYKDREYCAYDGSPIELWRTCKINFNKAFGRYSELELELAYVHYVLRKEATCRRCKAQGVFALIDCKNTSVASIAWQTSKLRVMTTFMAKYGEQFFPDSISKALVYNAPKGADFIWKLFSSALSAATRERVQVISGDGKEEIAKLMDPRVVKQLEDLLPD